MKRKSISLTLLAMLLTSIAAVLPTSALPADSMWITPTSIDGGAIGYGNTFQVTVWLNVTTGTNAWQFYLTYPSALLNATACDYSGVGKSLWSAALPVDTVSPASGTHDGTYDYVTLGEVLKNNAEKTGAGSLAIVTFKIIAAPGKYETLSDMIRLDLIGSFNSYCLRADFSPVTLSFGSATYSYTWTTPPNPHLEVVPNTLEFGPAPPTVNGTLFDVDIYIMGLSAEWNLHNASFTLTYDNTELEVVGWTVDALWATSSVTDTPPTLDVFVADPTTTPSGNVLVITVQFNITDQETSPDPADVVSLDLSGIILWNTIDTIPYDPAVGGEVTINAMRIFNPAYFEISSVTMGPGPSRGLHFNVTVTLNDVVPDMYALGYDFKLKWCIGSTTTLITPVAMYEGPFLPYYSGLQDGSLGTFWTALLDDYPPYGPHIVVGNMIYPNATGRWNPLFPDSSATDNTVAIIEFVVEYQSFGDPDMSCSIEIVDQNMIGIKNPADDPQEIVVLEMFPPVNGTYEITTDWPGRAIDVYTQYPAPFGGQGFYMPSDMFWPQKEVELYANVTYNYWPVQQKDVAFEIRDPSGALWAVLVARTDVDGVAYTSFRIPWPCDNPEDLFGVWTVTATVDVACIVITDELEFHFDYLVQIFKVTTDKFEYDHCDEVCVTIEYGTHAQQEYPLVLMVVIKDELNVPIGVAYIETTIGGAVFCQYEEYTDVICIHIDKFAFAGIATVHVTAYNALPSMGGSAYGPEYTPIPEIAIQPY